MSKIKAQMSISLDGYGAGLNQTVENPLGERGEELHEWVIPLRAFKRIHGERGGEESPSNAVLEEAFENIGATIMGRNMFGGGPGPWSDEWKGWWGENPPYHHPVFVLTHHAREPVEMEGGTTFNFVTEGIEAALEQANAAAGDKDVMVAGGADALRQYLTAGLIDELELHLVPLLLGAGERPLEGVGNVRLEQTRAIEGRAVTHLKYRVVKP